MQSWSESNRLHSTNKRIEQADYSIHEDADKYEGDNEPDLFSESEIDALVAEIQIDDILAEIQEEQNKQLRKGIF